MIHDFAVYGEHSDSNKGMVSTGGLYGGWNTRVFNRTEVHPASGSIRLEPGTGTIVLTPGIYHITAVSIVSYFEGEAPRGGVPSKNPALGGYCRRRVESRPGCATSEECLNEDAVAIGTMTSANLLPSLIDTYLQVDKPEARLVLEHQIGAEVAGVNLQLYVVNSTWHVMARISISRVGDVVTPPVKPVDARITSQLAPLAEPGTRASSINRVFNAALGELLGQEAGTRYQNLYKKYIGIEPRFPPRSSDCDPWVDAGDPELKALLARGVLRYGYVAGAPYVDGIDGQRTGLDYDLGVALAGIISLHYLGDAHRLHTEWHEVSLPPGDEQAEKLGALCEGLADGVFDIALTGQMMLPPAYLPPDYEVEWTAPTALLFTAITYLGRDRHLLNLRRLDGIRSGTLEDFLSYALAESRRLQLELRFFAVTNPGPSPGSAMNVVSEINRGQGRAVWDIGDTVRSGGVMLTGFDHFSVGDSLISGATTLLPEFSGVYLNVPANLEKSPDGEEYVGLWPLAGFTAKRRRL
jgi:hypothetical protein